MAREFRSRTGGDNGVDMATSQSHPLRPEPLNRSPVTHRGAIESNNAQDATAATATNAGQDQQHAIDMYQKGMEIAHNANTYEDHCRAIEHFSLAIAIRSNQARFFLARGNAFRAINEFEHAAKDYGSAIVLDDRCALYYANRGACYRKLNQPIKALEDLTAAVEVDGKKGPHYFNRALVLQDAGFFKEAIIDFTRALEDGSGSGGGGGIGIRLEYRALQGRGLCYRRVGNLGRCIDDLQAAIKLDSRNSMGFSALALAYFESEDYDAAIEQFSRAIESNDTNASYFNYRGICYYRKGESFARECLADFNRCIQLDGNDPEAYFYRGSVRLALALGLGCVTNTTTSSKPAAKNPVSNAAAESSRPPSDNGESTAIPNHHPDQPTATPKGVLGAGSAPTPSASTSTLQIVGFFTPAEQLEAAYADIEMAWTLCEAHTHYQVGMAMIQQLKQRYDDAVALFGAVTQVDHEHDNVLVKYHLALCCCMVHDEERAIKLLTDAIDYLPTEPIFFESRGMILQELGHHALAIHDFSAAISKKPPTAEVGLSPEIEPLVSSVSIDYYLRGESHLRLGDFHQAFEDCVRALDLGYRDVSVLNARGMAYRGLGKLEKAIDDLNVISWHGFAK